jgi:hypothetical protein
MDLRDVVLPNGNHLQRLEPLRRYRVRRSGPGAFEADLVVEGLMPPPSNPDDGSPGAPPAAWRRTDHARSSRSGRTGVRSGWC